MKEIRLIDANALKAEITRRCGLCDDKGTSECQRRCLVPAFEETVELMPTAKVDNYNMGYQDGVRQVLKEVAEGKHRPHGTWQIVEMTEEEKKSIRECRFNYRVICSECKAYYRCICNKIDVGILGPNFCPNCGADMREDS